MPKANKSSASAGTRKKNAKKAAKKDGDDGDPKPQQHKPQRGQKKLSKAQQRAQPKIKQFIPPPKPPAPPIPDPLDGQGLARSLPAELVVILRRLGKKDDVTRRKGLEELREWVVDIQTKGLGEDAEVEREIKESALLSAVPVWMHNLASLLQSPFHRSSALQLHADLLSIPSIRHGILETIALGLLPGTQNRDILGSWLVAALEEGRRAGGSGLKSWETSTVFVAPEGDDTGRIQLSEQLVPLAEYVSLSILDPPALHDDIHPVPVASSSYPSAPTPKGAKAGKARFQPILTVPEPQETSAEDLEAASEKWARYRVGGLVALSWILQHSKQNQHTLPEQVSSLLRNPALWSSLSSLPLSEGSAEFGFQQPPVRRAAYAVLGVLVEQYPEELESKELRESLASNLLSDCWLEKEATVWEVAGPVIVKVLSRNRELWNLVSRSDDGTKTRTEGEDNEEDEDEDEQHDAEEDDGEESEGDVNAGGSGVPSRRASTSAEPSHSPYAFERFLEFTATICPTIPHLTYPLLLIIISTIPPSLLPLSPGPTPALKNLFAHLWSPVDARLLSTHSLPGQPSAFQAFLRDTVDCTLYLIGKSAKMEDGKESVDWLVIEQLGERVWKEGVLELGGRSAGKRAVQGTRPEQEAAIFGRALSRLNAISPDLAQALLEPVAKRTVEASSISEAEKRAIAFLPRILSVLTTVKGENSEEGITSRLNQIITMLAHQSAESLRSAISASSPAVSILVETLVDIVKTFPSLLDADTGAAVSQIITTSSKPLVGLISPDLYIALLSSFSTVLDAQLDTIRGSLWGIIHDSGINQDTRFALTTSLLVVNSALLNEGSLDTVTEEAAQTALSTSNNGAAAVAAASVNSQHLSDGSRQTVLALVSTSLHDNIQGILSSRADAKVPTAAVDIFASYAKSHLATVIESHILLSGLVAIHHLVVLLPRLREAGHNIPSSATELWSAAEKSTDEVERVVWEAVLSDLAGLIQDISCRVEPSILVDVSLVVNSQTEASTVAQRILPDASHIHQLVTAYTSRTPDSSLLILDPLLPYPADEEQAATAQSEFDSHGRSKAARLAEAVLALIRSDRQLASTNPSLLRTVLSARALSQDAISVPGASRGFLAETVSIEYLEEIVREAEGALSFCLASFDEVALQWHQATVELLKKDTLGEQADFLQRLLWTLRYDISTPADDVSARTLRDVLEKHLRQSGAGEKEAEIWLNFAMTKLSLNPTLASSIISATKSLLLDSKPFVTAQNRLANHLSGISASKANAIGVPALRLLIVSSPPLDSTSVFLPQQRALFVIRHISSWLTSEEAEYIDEEVEIRIAELYATLAPIVQDVSGGHWDSIFDLIETGLEAGSLDDKTSLGLLHHCLILLRQVRDLCETNKSLRALWTSKKVHLGLVFKLFLQCRDARSVPMQLIQDLLLDLLTGVTEDVVGDNGLPELSQLIGKSTSSTVQTTAYRLLHSVIKRKTLALVLEVEASVAEAQEGHQSRTIHLPEDLVSIVSRGSGLDWHEDPLLDQVLGQLLAWMAILDHFDDASRSLRWAYLDQLTTSDLLTSSLLPLLFAILGISEVGAWNFPASQFAVDEFYPDLLQPEDLADLSPLASYVFYRALVTIPSSLRTYYESIKDRQLSMSMLNFVARHYSPVIIAHEFSALREPGAMATLTEEGLNIRIAQGGGATVAASAGASEAIASYVVDEQPMEIGIRLPAEFPLRGVDVRDLRRAGVPENKWRGWLMSVQQTITSRNGLILEALTVFKKNVSLHFEGAVECAICYSIISLTDRTLPTKPCRTCKNRFHASCLYKWFNSSHSSSCPLCRALF